MVTLSETTSSLTTRRRLTHLNGSSESLVRCTLVALAVLAAIQAGVLIYHLASIVAFPYDLDYGEGYLLNDAVRLSHREPIYVDLRQFPMVRSPYPPVYPWLWSLVIPLAGPTFWPGRGLSVLATAAIAALVGFNALRAARELWPAVAAMGLVAASPFVYDWAAYARVDMVALALSTLGVLAAQHSPGRRGVAIAALACGLALWTKQTAITAALAVAIALTLRTPLRGLAFVALVGVPSAIAGALLNAATDGEFAHHVMEGNASNPILPLRALVYMGVFGALHLPALAACLWWLRRTTWTPIATYLVVSLLGAFSAGNGGSSVNYLIEPLIALALVVPFAWRTLPARAGLLAPALAALQLVVLLHVPNGFGTGYLAQNALGRTPTSEDAAIGAQLDAIVRQTRGDVITEPSGFAVRNDRAVYVQPIDLRAEQLRGRWQPAPLVDALASGRFSVVLTAYNLFPSDAERAIADHFAVTNTFVSPDGLTFNVYRYQYKR
jgi:Dolichyl-phosphate-mannose-protein mannosyltransferase